MTAATATLCDDGLAFSVHRPVRSIGGPGGVRRPTALATVPEAARHALQVGLSDSAATQSRSSTTPRSAIVGTQSAPASASVVAATHAAAAVAAALVAGARGRRWLRRRQLSGVRGLSVARNADKASTSIVRDRDYDDSDSERSPRGRGRGGGAAAARAGARSGGRSVDQKNVPGLQFTSPWTGKVYDRWAPIGLDGKGDELYKQSGLGAARAYETPVQRKLREALSEDDDIAEWEKYYPGTAPEHLMPEKTPEKVLKRHAYRAGNFSDIFKQLVVQSVVDLKVQKSAKEIWYVETCGGEGEYHVGRLRKPGEDRPPMKWPTAEIFYDALKNQDMTYMPPEIQGWVDAVKFLNQPRPEFEEDYDPMSEWKALEPETVERVAGFLQRLQVQPWGVLGKQLLEGGEQVQAASPPDSSMALVVPMSVKRMKKGPQGAAGAEGEACRWLGIDEEERFPDDVFWGIRRNMDAHFHAYDDGKMVIHVACPDFSKPRYRNERGSLRAMNDLALLYKNVFVQFAQSGLQHLRLFPLPSKLYVAGYADDMPQMTRYALCLAYHSLDAETKQRLDQLEPIEMCIFRQTDVEGYTEAFEAGAPERLPKLRLRPGDEAEEDEEPEELEDVETPTWLPSTALVALRGLRRQDPVTLYEDNPAAFGPLFNFVRNFSDYFKPKVELALADGFTRVRQIFCNGKATTPYWYQPDSKWRIQKKKSSKMHGKYAGQRGIVFADPDWDRGGEAYRTYDLINRLHTHWMSATIIVAYPLGPNYEQKARKLAMQLRQNKKLDLMTAELYVDTPEWTPESEEDKWRGCGVIISSPPYMTKERIKAALSVTCQELMKLPGAHNMRFDIQALK